MKIPNMAELLNGIGDELILEAVSYRPKQNHFFLWGKYAVAAACVCLLMGGTFFLQQNTGSPDAGKGNDSMGGGMFPNGVDPVISSIAVYPDSVTVQDVEDATLEQVDETAAYQTEKLGAYLPKKLPDGYRFQYANLYETTMKNGETYHLLRAGYTNGAVQEPNLVEEDGEVYEVVPDPNEMGDTFLVLVSDYPPRTKDHIYRPGELSAEVLAEQKDGVIYFQYGEIYLGFCDWGECSVEEKLAMFP